MADREAILLLRIEKARRVVGRHLVFRDAEVRDAAFILALRTSTGASRFLSATSPDAERIGETRVDYLYWIDGSAIASARARYGRFIPDPVVVEGMP